jgi:hypothetical protein
VTRVAPLAFVSDVEAVTPRRQVASMSFGALMRWCATLCGARVTMMMNPFAALSAKDDDDGGGGGGGGGFRKVNTAARVSMSASAMTTATKKKKKSAAEKRAALAAAQEVEAARARAHALIEAQEAKAREAQRVGFEKVAKGSGIAKSVAKKIAKTIAPSEDDGTAAEGEDDDDERRRGRDDERSSDDSNELDDVVKVSKVFWHTFEGGKGAWSVNCEELGEDGGNVLCVSITKIVPRVRKISKDAGEKPILIDAEVLMIKREWNEQTRIDRARRAKAKAKAAKAAAKAAAEAGETVIDAAPVRATNDVAQASVAPSSSFDRTGTSFDVPVQEHVAAPLARRTSTPPPGFGAPVHAPVRIVHVPVVDPHAEAKQRALEAQIAALHAQLAAQTTVSAPRAPPPGFGQTAPSDGKYVPPARRRAA